MGPPKECGWGRRIRTPATWSRATRPTTRRSPTKLTNAGPAYHTGPQRAGTSADRHLQTAARAEARHLGRRNGDLLARARVAAVARRAPRNHERAKSGNCHPPAATEGVDDAGDHGVHGSLRRGLGAAGGLRHDRDEIRLDHASF